MVASTDMNQKITADALSYRLMIRADVEQVLKVEAGICEIPWTRRNFESCIDSDYQCWMMHKNNQHIGHSVLSAAAGEAHLLNISIAKNFQGQSLGRTLLRYMLECAENLKAQTVFLEVRASNSVAQALYLSEGFNEVGLRPAYYPSPQGREDAVIMAFEI